MARKTKAEVRREELERAHDMYSHYNQTDPYEEEVEFGHPGSEDYLILRAKFDSLKYASNSATRVVAYRSPTERVEYEAPKLNVDSRWYAAGSLEEKKPLLPAEHAETMDPYWGTNPCDGEKWTNFLKAAKRIGWHEALEPKLRCGTFRVSTNNYRLVADLTLALQEPLVPFCYERRDMDYLEYWIHPGSVKRVLKVFEIVEKRFKRWAIPPRTPEDREVDEAPLPLHLKGFTRGRVKHVEVQDFYVVIPLIPLNHLGDQVVRNTMLELQDLCRQGYPWAGPVREYHEEWLKYKKDLKALDREFKDNPPYEPTGAVLIGAADG